MSRLVVEPFDNVAAWSAHRPNGAASAAISVALGGPAQTGRPSAVVQAGPTATGHYVERKGAAVDLRPFSDLQLEVRGQRLADGADNPFYVEVRLGAAALAVGAAGNAWHRLVPVAQPGAWQPVPLDLGDLAPGVRSAMTTVRLRCLDAGKGWSLALDQILAVRDDMLADLDDALRARLDGLVLLGNTPVPAVVVPVAGPPPAAPFFRISNYDVRPDPARSPSVGQPTDHTEKGFALRPPSVAYAVYYAVEAVAADRASAARMLDAALLELAPVSTLSCNGRPLTVEWVDGPVTVAPPVSGPPPDHPMVHLRVSASQARRAAPVRAVPVSNIVNVEVDQRARA